MSSAIDEVSKAKPYSKEWHKAMIGVVKDNARGFIWFKHILTWDSASKKFNIFPAKIAHEIAARIIESGVVKEIGVIAVGDTFESPQFDEDPIKGFVVRPVIKKPLALLSPPKTIPAATSREILGFRQPYIAPTQTFTPTKSKGEIIKETLDKYLS